jgi:hypothetical protein
LDAHAYDRTTAILHELKMPRPSARVDIAVVNGELCGFEIKSDVDALTRLPRQVRAFSAVFDRVSIVTTARHVDNAKRIVPEWWGILAPTGTEKFVQIQQSRENPNRDVVAALHMLTRSELCELLEAYQLLSGRRSKPRKTLMKVLESSLSTEEMSFAIRYALKQRSALSRHCHPQRLSPARIELAL